MKVYHLFDEDGVWQTVTQSYRAVKRKCVGLLGQSVAGGGAKTWRYYEEDVGEDYSPEPMDMPGSGCKKFVIDKDAKGVEVDA